MNTIALAVFAGGFVLNFFVPYGYFFCATRLRGKSFHPLRTIRNYASGMIGDALFVPVINLALYLSYAGLSVSLSAGTITFSVISGAGMMALMHVAQAAGNHVNWSMPKPWQWAFPGKYHMVSATIEMSYIVFSLLAITANFDAVARDPQRSGHLLIALLVSLAFLATAALDHSRFRRGPAGAGEES